MQKGEEKIQGKAGIYRQKTGQLEATGAWPAPLNRGAVPLILRGPPSIIKGAALPARCPVLSFCGEGFSGTFLLILVKNLNS